MSKENMKLWESVSKTPEEHTKPGQNLLTSIKGQYCFMRATEAFGPCGIGWGYEILDEEYRDGAMHFFTPAGYEKPIQYNAVTHTIKIKLWYVFDGKKGEVINYGHTPFIMKSKHGPYQDDDPAKKSLTDAIKKCLSMIGVGADVHLGQFEDLDYKEELRIEAKQEKERKREEKESIIKNEISSLMKKQPSYYDAATTLPALNAVHKQANAEVKRLYEQLKASPDTAVKALHEKYEEVKQKLTGKGE